MKKFFTGLGDDGTTGLLGEERVEKCDERLEAIGSLDELSAFLGFAKSLTPDMATRKVVDEIQRDLYGIMTQIAAMPKNTGKITPFSPERLGFLEKWLTAWGEEVDLPGEFILPGETNISAAYSISRTQTRKAERQLVKLSQTYMLKNKELLQYINRLSSLLYLLEVKYSKKGSKTKLKFAKG
jgi:cob(I)alamin adenosyltransferase